MTTSKFDFGRYVRIPSEEGRLVWATKKREALKKIVDSAPKRKPAPCPDCVIAASGADPFADSDAEPGTLLCWWTKTPTGLRCVTQVKP